MVGKPIVVPGAGQGRADPQPLVARGTSFSIEEWQGSGPSYLHVHHADDEAWHVLEGTLRFRFVDRTVDVAAGGTVFALCVTNSLPFMFCLT